MLASVLALAFLPLVLSQADPTKVCMPDTIEFITVDLVTDQIAVVSIDFTKKLLSSVSPNRTVVDDIANSKSYVIDATGNCQSYDAPLSALYPQCLPATAQLEDNIYIGFGPERLQAEAWFINPYSGGTLRLAFSKQPNQPSYPVLSKFVDSNGDVFTTFYVNPNTTISNPDSFKIPDPCPPSVIV
ncbi:uncharacterized protein LOC131930233 [Physella acuta]|uniref:uncharacterized protein LOC131930233 n=1 Tax=Physella acuta TaxID=109671 RepID=UPI0027DBB4BC|nr:uncharacterized protein LOC131930233 [Physella acuta]